MPADFQERDDQKPRNTTCTGALFLMRPAGKTATHLGGAWQLKMYYYFRNMTLRCRTKEPARMMQM